MAEVSRLSKEVRDDKVAEAAATTSNLIDSLDEFRELIVGKVMCFTGRRPKDLCWYVTEKYNGFVSWCADFLYQRFYVEKGVRTFITGGAQGIDQLMFWAVELMKRRYKLTDVKNVVFAVAGQHLKWAKDGAFSQEQYRQMLRTADILCYVSGGSIKALFDRNHLMCDWSDIVLGVYPDDTWTSNKGGTSECLRYATNDKSSGREVMRLGYSFDKDGCLMAGALADCWAEKEPSMFA